MEKQWKVFGRRLIRKIRFEREGFLVDVILQDCLTKDVLFGASMTRQTLKETIERGQVVLFSRSRKTRWLKGEVSGDYLKVASIRLNCENNQLLIQVLPVGQGVCHKKTKKGNARQSCFYRSVFEAEIIEDKGRYFRIKKQKKEEVEYYCGWGWLTQDELFDLRQTDPKLAP